MLHVEAVGNDILAEEICKSPLDEVVFGTSSHDGLRGT